MSPPITAQYPGHVMSLPVPQCRGLAERSQLKMGSGGSRSAPGSLDSVGWDPNVQMGVITMTIFSVVLYITGNIVLSLVAVVVALLPVPFIFLRYPKLQRKLLFHSWYYRAEHPLSQPLLFGLKGGVNRVVNGEIGCWYVRGTNDKVVVYCHGSSGSRGNCYRVELVNFLSGLGCSVYSFDYRGYGDSAGESSEVNMVADTKSIVKLARAEHPDKEIILYGHSLGTGVVCLTSQLLKSEGQAVDKIILEAPFLSIPDVLLNSPAVALLNRLPIYSNFVWRMSDVFCSKGVVSQLDNVLLLFAENDEVIPPHHPLKLHELCPASKLVLIPDGGHNFLIKQDRIKEEIAAHLNTSL